MRHSGRILAALVVAAAGWHAPARAQFGQNKVSYQHFDWQVYASPHFDVHYYPALEPFLEEIVSYAESAYLELSRDLDHELRFRVPLIIYKTHGEFQQTNVTLGEVSEGTLAFAEPLQYRMVLPIDQPPDMLYKVLAHELVHIFEFSIFFEGYVGRALRANAPRWLMEGLASYLADDEDSLARMYIRDAVVNNVLPPVQQLDVHPLFAYRYGHALFDYIEQEHGQEGLRSFLFEYKKVLLSNNLNKAFKESFGYDMDEFNRRFNRYLRKKYFPVLLENKSPDDYGTEIGLKRRGAVTFSPTLSPSGELVAALGVSRLELDLFVLSAEDGKKIRNLTAGWTNKYRHLVAEAGSGKRDVSWSPAADRVAVFARRENAWPLLVFDALRGKLVHDITLDNIYQCASPAFSPDGRRVAFEGNRDGVVDLFEIDLESREIRNLTQDDFFDANPWYSADGTSLLYNRRIGPYWKVFAVDLADPSKKTQLTFGPHSDIQPSYSRDGNVVFFASDRGPEQVFNIHQLDLRSGDLTQFTDVVGGCFAPVEMTARDGERYVAFQTFFEGGFRLYRMPLRDPELRIEASQRLAEVSEAEPFEPALQLRVDEDKKERYELAWDVEVPAVSIAVADDGTFFGNAALQFTDLLGDHRVFVGAASVSDFAAFEAAYVNLKHRYDWGATLFDQRDFFFVEDGNSIERKTEYRSTGATLFAEYPFSRHYRVQGGLGFLDTSQNSPVVDLSGTTPFIGFRNFKDQFATLGTSLVGDTVRFQRFGPYQGKRFHLGATYGAHLSGDSDGDLLQYRTDFRFYKGLTQRSLLAWRLAGIFDEGERQNTYGLGGLNYLRGFGFREFSGSKVAWSNLEFRFPLVDELRFPVLRLVQIRGLFFLDVGAAWFDDDLWYDPDLGRIRVDAAGRPIPFEFWDSENDQLQDGRAAYGFGFQFFFIGGLQFNWVWSERLDYTQVLCCDAAGEPIRMDADTGDRRMDFYIFFDF
jgi:hypothetical protein